MSSKLPIRLKELRQKNHETQEYVAKVLDVSVKTYRSWEKCQTESGIFSYMLIKLSSHYNVSTDYILGLSNFTSVDNEYIGQATGLDDDSINQLKVLNAECLYAIFPGVNSNNSKKERNALNFMIKKDSFFDFLYYAYNYFDNSVTTPVYFDENIKDYKDSKQVDSILKKTESPYISIKNNDGSVINVPITLVKTYYKDKLIKILDCWSDKNSK